MRIVASVLSNEQEILDNVIVTNLSTGKTTTTDAAGRFAIDVASGETQLRFSKVGYDYDTFKAKDIQSYVELYRNTNLDEVNVVNHAKSDNTGWWLLGSFLFALGAKKLFGKKKPQPRKVTIK